MSTATIHVVLLSCTHAKYELGILPTLRPHVRSLIPVAQYIPVNI